MSSYNKVILLGNLGQDPELRHTANQVAVGNLSIATTDYRKGSDGEKQEFTEWSRVVVWNKTAENCAKFLKKGSSVLVEGRLQTRSYEDKEGVKRYVTEVIASSVTFVGKKDSASDSADTSDSAPAPQQQPGDDLLNDIPF